MLIKEKTMKQIKLYQGSIDLDDLHDHHSLLFTGDLFETLSEMFVDADLHYYEKHNVSIINENVDTLEFSKYINKGHYYKTLFEDVRQAMASCYKTSLTDHYLTHLKNHYDQTINKLVAMGFEASYVGKNNKPAAFYEALYIEWVITEEAIIKLKENHSLDDVADFDGMSMEEIIEEHLNDLDVLNWMFIDYHGVAGNHDSWMAEYLEYSETDTLIHQDLTGYKNRLKELIKNRVPLELRKGILEKEFKGIKL